MLRILSYLIGLAIFGGGATWLWNTQPQIRGFFTEHLTAGDFHTLEARYTAEQIMENNKKTLLKDKKYIYLEPTLNFYPYALLEVKYSKDNHNTQEGILLWSLHDGELVLDTSTWDTTHGFQDCIHAKADKNDYRLLKTLAKTRNNSMDREALLNELHVENETLDAWVDSCRQKKLIVQKGNEYRLHFSAPKLTNVPETKIDQWLVTKPYNNATCIPKRYSVSQIENLAKVAFDNDFTIRGATEVYLPVYNIVVQNPDSSVLTTHWNALNGKRVQTSYVH